MNICLLSIIQGYLMNQQFGRNLKNTYPKVLYEKGYLDFSKNKGEGKTHMYVALVSRAEYTRRTMQDVKKNFFGGNLKSMFSYFVREENLSPEEIQELLSAISEE